MRKMHVAENIQYHLLWYLHTYTHKSNPCACENISTLYVSLFFFFSVIKSNSLYLRQLLSLVFVCSATFHFYNSICDSLCFNPVLEYHFWRWFLLTSISRWPSSVGHNFVRNLDLNYWLYLFFTRTIWYFSVNF